MLLLFIVGISAYAFGPEPESTCSVVEYDQTISGEAQFRSTEFTCVKGNGDFLSYGFDNTADADCMVELYKKGLIWDTKVSSMTVRPHDPGGKTEVIRNPSDSTFYFVLYLYLVLTAVVWLVCIKAHGVISYSTQAVKAVSAYKPQAVKSLKDFRALHSEPVNHFLIYSPSLCGNT